MENKYIEIETQALGEQKIDVLIMLLKYYDLAKETGHTHVRDNWGLNAYDEYTIDEAIEQLKKHIKDTVINRVPSDVEILLTSSSQEYYVNDEQRIGFQKGAKWIIEKMNLR